MAARFLLQARFRTSGNQALQQAQTLGRGPGALAEQKEKGNDAGLIRTARSLNKTNGEPLDGRICTHGDQTNRDRNGIFL